MAGRVRPVEGKGGDMTRSGITRRRALASAAALGSFAIIGRARAATPYKPTDSLVEAARKEGKFILYTATFTEVEQEVINEFRKKFPFVPLRPRVDEGDRAPVR